MYAESQTHEAIIDQSRAGEKTTFRRQITELVQEFLSLRRDWDGWESPDARNAQTEPYIINIMIRHRPILREIGHGTDGVPVGADEPIAGRTIPEGSNSYHWTLW